VSLEPVYAIVLAILLLGEQRELSVAFYLGVAVILASVFAHSWSKVRSTGS
jgi:drug/metabolite transporter (DMT)-like permease